MADLQDSASLSLGMGVGIAADLKAGMLTHPSFGTVTASAMLGSDSRDVAGSFYQVSSGWPHSMFWAHKEGASGGQVMNSTGWRAAFEVKEFQAAFVAIGHPTANTTEIVSGMVEGVEAEGTIDDARWLPIPPELSFNEVTDLQVGATLLLVSARAGFNPLEFLDFLLGFAGVDIAEDDPK
jgi:hypothetical protein